MTPLHPGVEPQALPEPAFFGVLRGGLLREDGFTADQVRAIEAKAAQAGYLAGLEAAAKVCEQNGRRANEAPFKDYEDNHVDGYQDACVDCATAIINLKDKQ